MPTNDGVIYQLGDNMYVAWSSIASGPLTFVMTREEMIEYISKGRTHPGEGQENGLRYVRDRLARIDARGHSMYNRGPCLPEDLIVGNQAGPGERHLTLAGILAMLEYEEHAFDWVSDHPDSDPPDPWEPKPEHLAWEDDDDPRNRVPPTDPRAVLAASDPRAWGL